MLFLPVTNELDNIYLDFNPLLIKNIYKQSIYCYRAFEFWNNVHELEYKK